ncbi:MAG TPA: hypothetical protein VHE55_11315 [Fimbriimonadaceae bacterium]|nr:hypothetical protein [Fimbriimonadaceae bacterium]
MTPEPIAPRPAWTAGDVFAALKNQELDKAEEIAVYLVSREPYNIGGHVAFSETLNSKLRHEEAALAAKRALALDPFNLSAGSNLACALIGLGYYREAKEILDRILAARPGVYNAHWLRSLANLGLLNFTEGFADYEYRFMHGSYPRRCPPHTYWRGDKTDVLFIYGEQGLGDQIQFCRFIDRARERCQGKVVMEVAPPLAVLMENMADQVWAGISDLAIPVAYTAHIPMISLPFILGIDQIDGSPYLGVQPQPVDLQGAKVGLCWKGNPDYSRDLFRSLTLDDVRTLQGAAPFACVQPADELPFDMPQLSGCDLGATAFAIDALDLVVTVDTVIAHLAGAMGKECWLIAPRYGEWRWGTEGTRTPWYDSIEVFRAPGGDRAKQLETVRARLIERYPPGTWTEPTTSTRTNGKA